MARRRDLSADEAKLWRRVAGTTKAYKVLPPAPVVQEALPLMGEIALPIASSREMPHLALKRAEAVRLLASRPTSTSTSASTGLKLQLNAVVPDASGHKKVRRGKLVIDARIDLHGMRQIAAHSALAALVERTRAQNGRCILVVTGKGAPIDPGEDFITPQPGVIRRRLPEWLNGAGIREHVSGFSPAHAKDGGSGAFYVLLKRPPLTK